MRPSDAHRLRLRDLVLHALRFSLGKLWIHRLRRCFVAETVSDIHGSIGFVKNCLKIFDHAKLLTSQVITILDPA